MHITLFTHPSFQGSESMPKYAQMLVQGLGKRGHQLEVLTANKLFYDLPSPAFLNKWLGYMDQFVVFPLRLRKVLRKLPEETLFVFADHALGPWIPYVAGRPHVIHCHDFLAQKSALGLVPENKVAITGKIYQAMIRRGFRKGKNFISISGKTHEDLHQLIGSCRGISKIVYNGFNQDFRQGCQTGARSKLSETLEVDLTNGFILHVGGNQFYKNRKGVIGIYNSWRETYSGNIPLIMVGPPPTKQLLDMKFSSGFARDIHFVSGVPDQTLQLLYHGACLLLFPSLEEGFGWPIAEAMASGCLVLTTNKPPMNEVGADCCFYLPAFDSKQSKFYEFEAGQKLQQILSLSKEERQKMINAARISSRRFNTEEALDAIEALYREVLENEKV